MKLKKIVILLLVSGIAIIFYFFIKEQFNGIVLTHGENMLLAFTYLGNGILILIFSRIKYLEKKSHDKREN